MKRNEIDALITLIKGGYVQTVSQSQNTLGKDRSVRIIMDMPLNVGEMGELSVSLQSIYGAPVNSRMRSKNKSFKIMQRKHEKEILAQKKGKKK